MTTRRWAFTRFLPLQAGPDVLRLLTLTDEELADGLARLRAALFAFLAALRELFDEIPA